MIGTMGWFVVGAAAAEAPSETGDQRPQIEVVDLVSPIRDDPGWRRSRTMAHIGIAIGVASPVLVASNLVCERACNGLGFAGGIGFYVGPFLASAGALANAYELRIGGTEVRMEAAWTGLTLVALSPLLFLIARTGTWKPSENAARSRAAVSGLLALPLATGSAAVQLVLNGRALRKADVAALPAPVGRSPGVVMGGRF